MEGEVHLIQEREKRKHYIIQVGGDKNLYHLHIWEWKVIHYRHYSGRISEYIIKRTWRRGRFKDSKFIPYKKPFTTINSQLLHGNTEKIHKLVSNRYIQSK